MTTTSDVSAAYSNVHAISMMAPFIGLCQSTSLKASFSFSSITMCLCIFLMHILKPPYTMELLSNVLINSSYGRVLFFKRPNENFFWATLWGCSFDETLPYFLSFETLVITALSVSFQCGFKCLTFLLNSLKLRQHESWVSRLVQKKIYALHHLILHCTICIMSVPSHKH
jgi:hypothetical protein